MWLHLICIEFLQHTHTYTETCVTQSSIVYTYIFILISYLLLEKTFFYIWLLIKCICTMINAITSQYNIGTSVNTLNMRFDKIIGVSDVWVCVCDLFWMVLKKECALIELWNLIVIFVKNPCVNPQPIWIWVPTELFWNNHRRNVERSESIWIDTVSNPI